MGLINWTGLFGQNKKPDIKDKVDVNNPIENPGLNKAFGLFHSNKCEDNLMNVIDELRKAHFLVLAVTDEMKTTKDSLDNKVLVEKGSLIKFLNCYDSDRKPFLPVFTDWQEVDLWIKQRDNISGFVMSTIEAFEFAGNDKIYHGVVINPGSVGWTMSKEQLNNFIADYK